MWTVVSTPDGFEATKPSEYPNAPPLRLTGTRPDVCRALTGDVCFQGVTGEIPHLGYANTLEFWECDVDWNPHKSYYGLSLTNSKVRIKKGAGCQIKFFHIILCAASDVKVRNSIDRASCLTTIRYKGPSKWTNIIKSNVFIPIEPFDRIQVKSICSIEEPTFRPEFLDLCKRNPKLSIFMREFKPMDLARVANPQLYVDSRYHICYLERQEFPIRVMGEQGLTREVMLALMKGGPSMRKFLSQTGDLGVLRRILSMVL